MGTQWRQSDTFADWLSRNCPAQECKITHSLNRYSAVHNTGIPIVTIVQESPFTQSYLVCILGNSVWVENGTLENVIKIAWRTLRNTNAH